MENESVTAKIGRGMAVFFKALGTVLLVLLLAGLIFACIFAVYVKNYLTPQLEWDVSDFSLNETSVIYYMDNQTGQYKELQNLYGTENRKWAAYDELPKNLTYAAIAIEDKRFYDHQGVDWYRTVGAFGNMFLGMRDTFGGSTITQQLIKNLSEDDDVTVRRKLIEIFRALEFEKKYTKREILELYMNTIYLGNSAYGVKSASVVYFGKDVSELSLAECASLVGITNNPSIYDPYISLEKNKERQKLILQQMLEQGYIDQAQYEAAVAEELVFTRGESDNDANTTVYSYFVDQVIRDVVEDLREVTGYSYAVVNQMVTSGGYSIYATIDMDVQKALDDIYENLENIPETVGTVQQLQSGMCIIDNDSGDIVGLVGGVGKKEGSLTLNRATQSSRAPGSAIKPLSVYSPAIELGKITPATVMDDTPLTFEGGLWPKNYDSNYRGLMSINEAVAISNNTIAAKLVSDMTPEYCYNYLVNKFGFLNLVAAREVNGNILSDINIAPMALGGLTNGVTVKEITEAYETYANNGVYREARTYTQVVDSKGRVILDNQRETKVSMKEKTAYYITYMLQNAVDNGTGIDAKLGGMAVAGKTGTTTNDFDRWFCGYTPYYCASVWVGYDQQEEVVLKDNSVNPAAYLWKLVMEKIHVNKASKEFFQPSTVINATYCCDSGLVATQWCEQDIRGSRVVTGKLALEDVPTGSCNLHAAIKICNGSGKMANDNCTSTHEVGMLNYLRSFPVSGVEVQDQKYMVGRYFTSVATGYYLAVSDDPDAVNVYCSIHQRVEVTGPIETTPETTEDTSPEPTQQHPLDQAAQPSPMPESTPPSSTPSPEPSAEPSSEPSDLPVVEIPEIPVDD